MFWSISEGVKLIAKQMVEHPEEWQQSQYEFWNKSNPDIRIWVANGTSFITMNNNSIFTLAEKYCLANAIKKSIGLRLGKESPPR